MAIDPTSLSDILTMPDLPLEPGGRPAGQDFSQFFSELSANGSDVGLPTELVGNPTPQTEPAASPEAASEISEASSETPLQTLMMIADKLGLEPAVPEPTLQATSPVPLEAGGADVPVQAPASALAGTQASLPVIAPAGEAMDAKAEGDAGPQEIDPEDKDGDVRQPVAVSASHPQPAPVVVAPSSPPVSEIRSAGGGEPRPPLVAGGRAKPHVIPANESGMFDPVINARSDQPLPVIQGKALAVGHEGRVEARPPQLVPLRTIQEAQEASPGAAVIGEPGADLGNDEADPALPPAPAHSMPDSAPQPTADRHVMITPSGHTPVVAGPAPLQAPGVSHHQQALEDLLIGNSVEDQWTERLSQDVAALISSDNREARLHLRPRELGDLSIKLEMNKGEAKVHFTVETVAAQTLIAEAAPRLQAMIESRGFKLDQASVDIGGNGPGKGGAGGQNQSQSEAHPFMAKVPSSMLAEVARKAARLTAFERYA